MIGKKEKLSEILSKLKINELLIYLRGYFFNDLKVLAYHRICDIDDINDRELVSASVADFDWQVGYLKKYCTPLTFEEVIKYLRSNEKLPKNAIVITFDDGFADNYINAFPVLKKHNVAATFFISTAYIGSNITFWFNLVSRMIMQNAGKTFELKSVGYQISEDFEQRLLLVSTILEVCKSLPNFKRLELLDEMKQQLNYIDECDLLAKPMSWDNVREMSDNGMEFGSHSLTHPILSRLTFDELKTEIHDSKLEIEKKIYKKIHTISYPEGMEYTFDLNILDEVEKAGYLLGLTYITGNNHNPKLKEFQLQRGHIERYIGRAFFTSMLSLPELYL